MRVIGNKPVDGEVRLVASGALPNGKPVVVNSDGTGSIVEEATNPETLGEPDTFASTDAFPSIAYDSTNQKIVVAYTDNGNSNYGTAIVGTVSGTSISFGLPVVFRSEQTNDVRSAYDPVNNKVVVAYRDSGNSNYGTAIVGTVSGTSIGFGSPVVFRSASADPGSVTFDTASGSMVIFYADGGNSNYGTAIVGTVSGTSIGFGSPTVFESAPSAFNSSVYDPDTQQVVVAYRDGGNSFYGTAVVGQISGTSISFGSPVVFSGTNRADSISTTYDFANNRVVVAYMDRTNSFYGTAVVGEISGTSISFGSPTVFESAEVGDVSASYNPIANKVVVSYEDAANNAGAGTLVEGNVTDTSISFGTPQVFDSGSDSRFESSVFNPDAGAVVIAYRGDSATKGKTVVFQSSFDSTNLTSENFIGFSNAAYGDADPAVIQTGCSVNEAQSGLTAGQIYYVQVDGTLNTTPGTPSVEAGLALSSTRLLIKG